MKKSLLIGAALLLVSAFINNPVSAQTDWEKYEGNPVLDVGTAGSWDDDYILGPRVIYDGSTYKMWYTGQSGEVGGIGLATSTDGITWTKHPGPVLDIGVAGSWDDEELGGGAVLFDGTLYKMWYGGNDGTHVRAGYATSTDGILWDKYENNPVMDIGPNGSWDDESVYPTAAIYDGSTYHLWYSGSDGSNIRSGYAVSLDGITWTESDQNPVINLGPNGSQDDSWAAWPMVLATDTGYEMWYAGMDGSRNRMMYATSLDGESWQKFDENPVLNLGPNGSWDDTHVSFPGVIKFDDHYKLWYAGWHDTYRIGLAISTFTNVAAGPVSGTWTLANSPYNIQGEITIPNDSTLTIEPGVRVEFQGHYKLNVQGRIVAEGTETDLITFTASDTTGFSNNASSEGVWGGIRFDGTAATNDSSRLKYCVIEYAKTFAGNAGGFDGATGGGILIDNFNKLRVEQCLIQYNRVIGDYYDTGSYGGGIAIDHGANPEIMNNLIQHNICLNLLDNNGSTGGGIMVARNSNPLISGNTIRFNSATETGGGLGIWIDSDPLVTNNLIVENICLNNDGTGGAGGGVSIGFEASPTFINNTIADNSAGWIGGGFYSNGGDAVFINTIFANNHDIVEPFEGHEIGTWNMGGYTLDFHYSCLEGGEADIHWDDGEVGTVNFIQSIAVDPGLLSDYRLDPAISPCFGAGTTSCEINGITYNAPACDINGDPCPNPAGSNPDMGAFESPLSGHDPGPSWHWLDWAANPVLSPGPAGSWDDIKTWSPDVIFHDGQYHMWYAGDSGTEWAIGYATSDDGISWIKYANNPVLVGSTSQWYGTHLYVPRVVMVNGVYHMYFYNQADKVGHASSTNGIDWTITADDVLQGDPQTWDTNGCAVADVIYDGLQFKMWYTGYNASGVGAIGYATSSDGIIWEKFASNPVLERSVSGWDSELFYSTSVIFNGDQYIMWYSGNRESAGEYSRIGRAISDDGMNWTKISVDDPEIGYGATGTWNDAASFYPAVLLQGGEYKMWYNGASYSDLSRWLIGYTSMGYVDVERAVMQQPTRLMLAQNYPNPFNPITHFRYSIPENMDVSLTVYDVLGREIVALVNAHMNIGTYEVQWNGQDRQGNQVATGVYFARLSAGGRSDLIKMLMIK